MAPKAQEKLKALRNFTEFHLRDATGFFLFLLEYPGPTQSPPGSSYIEQTEMVLCLQLVTVEKFSISDIKITHMGDTESLDVSG